MLVSAFVSVVAVVVGWTVGDAAWEGEGEGEGEGRVDGGNDSVACDWVVDIRVVTDELVFIVATVIVGRGSTEDLTWSVLVVVSEPLEVSTM
jgi:hypothetical protein